MAKCHEVYDLVCIKHVQWSYFVVFFIIIDDLIPDKGLFIPTRLVNYTKVVECLTLNRPKMQSQWFLNLLDRTSIWILCNSAYVGNVWHCFRGSRQFEFVVWLIKQWLTYSYKKNQSQMTPEGSTCQNVLRKWSDQSLARDKVNRCPYSSIHS